MKKIGSINVAAAALLVATSATGLSAQVTADATAVEIEAIEMDAMARLANLREWDRAAALFRRAAELRPAGDPTAAEDLIYAARLSFYEGNERQSVRDFESAGNRALAMGDLVVAANAFADAAWVAHNRGYNEWALTLINRARLLSNSPLLPDDERMHLRSRWSAASPQ